MGVIKQLKQFLTGTELFPVTKSNAVYDDTLGRLDNILKKSLVEDDTLESDVEDSPRDADTLDGQLPSYYAKQSDMDDVMTLKDRPVDNNLLINTNFADPVAQRGTSFESQVAEAYTIDRWAAQRVAVVVDNDNGVVKVSADTTGTFSGIFYQKMDIPLRELRGKYLTVSFETVETGVLSFTELLPSTLGSVILDSEGIQFTDGNGHICYADLLCDVGSYLTVRFILDPSAVLSFKWAKAEIGKKATPHIPKSWWQEYLLCSRYFKIAYLIGFMLYNVTSTSIIFRYSLDEMMRITIPTCTIPGSTSLIVSKNGENNMDCTLNNIDIRYGGKIIFITVNVNNSYASSDNISVPNGTILIDAEL